MKNAARMFPAIVAISLLALGQIAAASEVFFLNAWNAGQRYRIMRYDGDGNPSPTASVINETNDGGAANVAWPSALKVNGKERVYASRFYNNKWTDVAVWESSDGVNFQFVAIALPGLPSDTNGVGPSQIYYAQGEARPYKMVVLLRGASGPGTSMFLADSVDGITWTRQGTILSASEPFEAQGFSPSWVTQIAPNQWALFYQAYRYSANVTPGAGPAAVALSSSPNGPFTGQQVFLEPNASSPGIVSAKRMNMFGTTAGQTTAGDAYILRNPAGGLEVARVTRQVGTTVYFDRPLLSDYTNGSMVHVAAFKIDPSYIYPCGGGWCGVFTGYGHFTDLMTEYTFEAGAPALTGPWSLKPTGIRFKPWTTEGQFSTENPSPLVDVTP